MNAQRRQGQLMTGFTCSPLGWLLSIGDLEVEGTVDVSSWTELDKRTKPATIELPGQWRLRAQPDDFRSAEQILREAAKQN